MTAPPDPAPQDTEPIPLGHRQTVKKYFESIRPSNGDAFEKKDEPKPEKK